MNFVSPSYVNRNSYLDQIIPFIGKNVIKVLVGHRRAGKSYILYQLIDHIKKTDPKANVIYINKEWYDFQNLKNANDLIEYVNQHIKEGQKTYLFIDEVQDIEEFEVALRHFQSKELADLYCTGSNSDILSSELATYLSGRYVEINIHSLSYIEFLNFHQLANSDDSLSKYLQFGGMPFLKHLELKEEIVSSYLINIYHTILLKDVVSRYQIRNTTFLETLVQFIAEHTGSLFSAKKISDYLKNQKISTSPQVVINYLHYLTSSFLVNKVPRSDLKGKKVFETNDKYYFSDIGLRNSIIGFAQSDISKLMENVVYNSLIINGYKVHVGKLGEYEVDFVAEKDGEKMYAQVAYMIPDEKVREREFGNLLKIKDNYPKIVVSMDKMQRDYKGVRSIYLKDFLSGNF